MIMIYESSQAGKRWRSAKRRASCREHGAAAALSMGLRVDGLIRAAARLADLRQRWQDAAHGASISSNRAAWYVPQSCSGNVPVNAHLPSRHLPLRQRRRTGGGDGGARPRNVETTGARVSYRPRNISHIFARCSSNFHSLSLCCLRTIKTSHSVATTGRMLRNKLTKHTSPARILINKNSANAQAYSHKMFVPAMLRSFQRLCPSTYSMQ